MAVAAPPAPFHPGASQLLGGGPVVCGHTDLIDQPADGIVTQRITLTEDDGKTWCGRCFATYNHLRLSYSAGDIDVHELTHGLSDLILSFVPRPDPRAARIEVAAAVDDIIATQHPEAAA